MRGYCRLRTFRELFDKNDLAARLRSLMSGCQTGEARPTTTTSVLDPTHARRLPERPRPPRTSIPKHAARADRAEGERAGEKATPR